MNDFMLEQDLYIPMEEFEERWRKARKLMKNENIDVLLVFSDGYRYGNVRYMANYISPSLWRMGLLILPMDGEPTLVIDRENWIKRLKHFSPVKNIIAAHTAWHGGFTLLETTINLLKEKDLIDSRIAIAGMDIMSGTFYQYILDKIPNGVINADRIIEELRHVKSENELALIKKATAIGEEALLIGMEISVEGISELEVAAEVRRNMIAGGEYFCGSLPYLYVQSGLETIFPLRQPYATQRKMQKGDMIFIDMSLPFGGYVTDLTRTKVIGPPNLEQKRILEAVMEAQKACFDAAKPGNKACDIWEAGRQVVERYGYEDGYTQAYSGHGIGVEIGESPLLNKDDTTILKTGMVLAIEPGLYFDEIGGARIEDVVHITDNGCNVLTTIKSDIW